MGVISQDPEIVGFVHVCDVLWYFFSILLYKNIIGASSQCFNETTQIEVSFSYYKVPSNQKLNQIISISRLNERIKNLKSRNNPNVVVGHYIGQGNLFGNVSKGLFFW